MNNDRKNKKKLIHHYAMRRRAQFNKKPVEGSICMKIRLKQSLSDSGGIFPKKWCNFCNDYCQRAPIARQLILHSRQCASQTLLTKV